jgi:ribose transport system ATP-binding protein
MRRNDVTEKPPVLQLKNINKSFSGVQVLHDISFDLYKGEVHCLVGENGAGKSTLIKIISGAYQPDNGEISYQGQMVDHLDPRWSLEHGISTIYQEIDTVPVLSVAENISLGNEPLKRGGDIDRTAMRLRAKKVLDDIEADIDVDVPVGTLKVAHQQMVVIAKALSLNSKVLILDEPTAVFTASEIDTLFKIIQRLKTQGIAIIYISHHLDEIFQIGDRITVLRDGWVTTTGRVEEFDHNRLVQAMVGRSIDFSQWESSGEPGDEALQVMGLTRKDVFENISFTLRAGEIVGVAGLVGSGRTEMARGLIGADPLDRGEVYIRGRKTRIRSPRRALALGIGMLPENRKEEGLVLVRPVVENVAYSAVESEAHLSIVPWKQIKHTVKRIISDLKIRYPSLTSETQYLSGGNQQKVVLAKWLAARCAVLVLDEPTRGVDVGARVEIYKLMQQLKQDGKAILMISSDLPEILTQADRILVMAKGKIVGQIPHEEATEEGILSLALQVSEGESDDR